MAWLRTTLAIARSIRQNEPVTSGDVNRSSPPAFDGQEEVFKLGCLHRHTSSLDEWPSSSIKAIPPAKVCFITGNMEMSGLPARFLLILNC
jgi:hypothetical protein